MSDAKSLTATKEKSIREWATDCLGSQNSVPEILTELERLREENRRLRVAIDCAAGLIHFTPPTHIFYPGSQAHRMQLQLMEVYAHLKAASQSLLPKEKQNE